MKMAKEKSKLSYEDEMAWKERLEEIREEKKIKETIDDINQIEECYHIESVQQKCFSLIDIIGKYLKENNGDFSEYDKFKKIFNNISRWYFDYNPNKPEKSVEGLNFEYTTSILDKNVLDMLPTINEKWYELMNNGSADERRNYDPREIWELLMVPHKSFSDNDRIIARLVKGQSSDDVYKFLYRNFSKLRDIMQAYIYDKIGYNKIKKYIPKDMRIRKQELSYDSLSHYYPVLKTCKDDLSLNKATTEVLKAIDKEQKKSKEKI